MIEALTRQLNRCWTGTQPPRPALRGALVAGIDRSPEAKVTIILFDGGGAPAAVAKVARDAAGEAALRAEHAALRGVLGAGQGGALACIPEPLALERIAGRLVLAQTAMPGVPMTARYYTPGHTADRAAVAADFAAARGWLCGFQHATRSGETTLDRGGVARWVQPVLDRFRAEFDPNAEEAALFELVLERARELDGLRLPLVGVHGDFWMGNLLVAGGDVAGVIDWELGCRAGLPFRDLYKFPTSYGFYLDRAYPGRRRVPGHPERAGHRRRWRRYGEWPNLTGFGYTWFGRGWFPRLVREHVHAQLKAHSIPAAANAVFFPLFLAEQAMTLRDPGFRAGYRRLLAAFLAERTSTWLWHGGR